MNTAASPAAESPEDQAALNAITDQLIAIAEKAPTHQLMLIALISTYTAIAITHPCCTRVAADCALREGGRLLISAMDCAPTNAPLH